MIRSGTDALSFQNITPSEVREGLNSQPSFVVSRDESTEESRSPSGRSSIATASRSRDRVVSRKKNARSRAGPRNLRGEATVRYLGGSVVFPALITARTKIHVFCNNARYKSSFIIRRSTIKAFGWTRWSSCHLTPRPVSTICKLTAGSPGPRRRARISMADDATGVAIPRLPFARARRVRRWKFKF